jgi:O-methyltransferase involved in polyketide biosynthesis
MRERSEAMRQHWRDEGLDLDFSDLIYQGDRNLVTEYLIARGWHVSTQTRGDLFARYGRLMPDDDDSAPFRKSIAVTAIRQ